MHRPAGWDPHTWRVLPKKDAERTANGRNIQQGHVAGRFH